MSLLPDVIGFYPGMITKMKDDLEKAIGFHIIDEYLALRLHTKKIKYLDEDVASSPYKSGALLWQMYDQGTRDFWGLKVSDDLKLLSDELVEKDFFDEATEQLQKYWEKSLSDAESDFRTMLGMMIEDRNKTLKVSN